LKKFRKTILVSFGALLVAIFVVFFWASLHFYRQTLALETRNKLMVLEKDAEIGRMAAQVAHDIRSPLAALGAAALSLEMPAEQRKLVEGSVARMQGIADDLLKRYRSPSAAHAAAVAERELAPLVEQVVAEKRLQHKDNARLKIDFLPGEAGLKSAVETREFQRLVSNLLNNSIEALGGAGAVSAAIAAPDGKVLLTIKDDGKGIPPGILAKLGQKGGTHGKAGGTGLGLYHARTTVEGWGGTLNIESAPGAGTTVTVALPRAGHKLTPGRTVVLLDDDALVHMNWKMAARAAGAELKAFKTPAELEAAAASLPKDAVLYIDSDLGEGARGEDTAAALHAQGFADITMATGHSADRFAAHPWLKVAGKEPPFG